MGIALLALGAFAAVALGATPGELSFVGAKVQGQGGVDGITGPDDVAVSRDGRSVYAVGGEDDAIATFKRRRSGKLKFINAKFDGQGAVEGLDTPIDVAVSPDSRNVYVTAADDDSIVTFKRHRRSGKLKFVNAKVDGHGGIDGLDGAYAVAVSPNGKNVYVTGDDEDALATFKRNRRNGKLKFVNAKFDGQGGVDGIADPEGMAVSSDGRSVYVAGTDDNAIATFKRNRHNGRLRFINAKVDGQGGVEGLDQAYETTVSPNGRNVYVTAYGSDSVATFKRNRHNGRLQFLNAKFDGANLPLGDPYDVAASRDGKNVYVAVYNNGTNSGVDTFKHNRHNGKLQFVNAKRDGVGNVDHVAGIWRLAITSDDRSIYVAAFDEPSVGIFKRHR